MNDEQRVRRANKVRAFLESDEWQEAWASYREMLIHEIEHSGSDEKALECRRLLRAANKARDHLTSLIADGELAKADLSSRKSNLRIA